MSPREKDDHCRSAFGGGEWTEHGRGLESCQTGWVIYKCKHYEG